MAKDFPMYGGFPGGDPREFTPDPECSTDEERAAHKAACEAWERGERPELDAAHYVAPGRLEDGTIVKRFCHKGGFGLGSFYIDENEL